jgi:hypothetical protein
MIEAPDSATRIRWQRRVRSARIDLPQERIWLELPGPPLDQTREARVRLQVNQLLEHPDVANLEGGLQQERLDATSDGSHDVGATLCIDLALRGAFRTLIGSIRDAIAVRIASQPRARLRRAENQERRPRSQETRRDSRAAHVREVNKACEHGSSAAG